LLTLDDFLIDDPNRTSLHKVRGDSMKDAGILEGDLVVVEHHTATKPGDIVAAHEDRHMGAHPGPGAPENSSSDQEVGKRMLCCWLWRPFRADQITNGWAKWDIRLEIDFRQCSSNAIAGSESWMSRIQVHGIAR